MEQAYIDNIQKGIDTATNYGVANGLTRETAYSISGRMAEEISKGISLDMDIIFNNRNTTGSYDNTNAAVNKIANDIAFYGIDKNIAQNMAQILSGFIAIAMFQCVAQGISQHMNMMGDPQK